MIFENIINDWVINGLERYSLSTRYKYVRMARYFKDFYELPLLDINDKILLKFFINFSKGKKLKTVKNALGCLSAFYDYCVCMGITDENPCINHTLRLRIRSYFRTSMDKIKTPKHAISVDEAIRLVEGAYLISFEFGLGTEFLLCSGLRLGELAALKKNEISSSVLITKNIENDSKELQHNCKWGSNGVIELPKLLIQKYQIFGKTHTSEWAFPYIRFFANQYSRRLGRLSGQLGIKHTTAHTLRRTALTWLADSGYSLSIIQRIARHTSIKMTEQYIDRNQIAIIGVTETLSKRLNGTY